MVGWIIRRPGCWVRFRLFVFRAQSKSSAWFLKLTLDIVLTSYTKQKYTSQEVLRWIVRHSRSGREGNVGTVRSNPVVRTGARLANFVRVLGSESTLSTHDNSSLFFLWRKLVLPWPWKMDRFVDEIIFGCKWYAGSIFRRRDYVAAGSWRGLAILLPPCFMANDAHLATLLAWRRLVSGGTRTFLDVLTCSDLFAHSEWFIAYFHDGALASVVLVCGWYVLGDGEAAGTGVLSG